MPCDRANFGKTEPKTIPDPGRHAVLIESSRQPHRIAEAATKQHLLKAQVTVLQLGAHPIQNGGNPRPGTAQAGLPQSCEGGAAELLGVDALVIGQHRTKPALIEATGEVACGLSHGPPRRSASILPCRGATASGSHPRWAAPPSHASARPPGVGPTWRAVAPPTAPTRWP